MKRVGDTPRPKPPPVIDDGPQRPRMIGGHVHLMTDLEWDEHVDAINTAAAEAKAKRDADDGDRVFEWCVVDGRLVTRRVS